MPKPLVEVNGEPLIDRLIRIFADNNAEEIVVICNDKTTLVSSHLMKIQEDGRQKRAAAEVELVQLENDIKKKMLELSAGGQH